jgi:hypothetical protein
MPGEIASKRGFPRQSQLGPKRKTKVVMWRIFVRFQRFTF